MGTSLVGVLLPTIEKMGKNVSKLLETPDLVLAGGVSRIRIRLVENVCRVPPAFVRSISVDV